MATTIDRPTATETPPEAKLPPGPRLPRVLQTAGFMLGGPRFLEACRRRYGNAVTFSTLFDQQFVMLFEPEMVKELFRGKPEHLHAGEANALLGPILGQRSVLLLDEDEHLRHRRLMLPPFHGQRMQSYAEVIRDCADTEIDSWPTAEEFPLLPSMQSLTLSVILRAVFGYEPGAAEDELRAGLRAMIEPLTRTRGMLLLTPLGRLLNRNRSGLHRFEQNRDAVDGILYDEIARRRAEDPEALGQRDDVFSALLLAQDEHGERLSDREIRDELVTLLLAGHETTATALSWTFDLLLHAPAVHRRALERDDAYLDAVAKESLRIRPVIPGVGRVVRRQPFRVNGYVIPPGVEINPSIRMIHKRADLYPEPAAFRPERFLGDDAPDTYTWVPFGGGIRRCIGASFALMEMRIVMSRVLERAALRAASPKLDEVHFRGITLAPKEGVRVLQDRPPAPTPAGA